MEGEGQDTLDEETQKNLLNEFIGRSQGFRFHKFCLQLYHEYTCFDITKF